MILINYLKAILISATLLAAAPTLATPPLSQKVSLQQFHDLLTHTAGRVPELSQLWHWMKQTERTDIYWTGSSVRGLIHWLYGQLQTKSIAKIKSEPPPSIKILLPRGGTDIDTVGPVSSEQEILKRLPKGFELDIIETGVYQQLVEMGGPTIGKILVNPHGVVDPLNGLQSYLDGILVLHDIPYSDYYKHPLVIEGDYSKTAIAIRFMRLLLDLPELKADTASIERIRDFAFREGQREWREDKKEYVSIVFEKFIAAAGYSPLTIFSLLSRFNQLGVLSKIGIDLYHAPVLATLLPGIGNGFPIQDLKYAQSILGRQTARSYLDFLEVAKDSIRTAEDFITLVDDDVQTEEKYSGVRKKWTIENIHLFSQLKPTADQVYRLLQKSYFSDRQKKNISLTFGAELIGYCSSLST